MERWLNLIENQIGLEEVKSPSKSVSPKRKNCVIKKLYSIQIYSDRLKIKIYRKISEIYPYLWSSTYVIFQSGIPLRWPIRRTIMVKPLRGTEVRLKSIKLNGSWPMTTKCRWRITTTRATKFLSTIRKLCINVADASYMTRILFHLIQSWYNFFTLSW